jgi:DNA polymerase-3 subunit beta
MNLTAERTALLSVLSGAREIAASGPMPIVSHARLSLVGNVLTVSATDLDMAIDASAEVSGVVDGIAILPAQQLFDICKGLPDGCQIEIQPDTKSEGGYIIRAGRSRYRLPSLDDGEWFVFPPSKYPVEFSLSETEFRRLIGTPSDFTSDGSRPILFGVFMHVYEGALSAVATQGQILCRITMPCPPGAEAVSGTILPKPMIQKLLRLVDGDVTVSVSIDRIGFSWGSTTLICKVIEATYPEYRRMFPDGLNTKIEASAAEIKAATSRIALVSEFNSTGKSRAIIFDASPSEVVISAVASEGREGSETLEITSTDAVRLGFNARYLADAMAVCGGSAVTIHAGRPDQPALIQPSDDEGVSILIATMAV